MNQQNTTNDIAANGLEGFSKSMASFNFLKSEFDKLLLENHNLVEQEKKLQQEIEELKNPKKAEKK